VAEFIGIKSYKARGKRLTKYQVEMIQELEPLIQTEKEKENVIAEEQDDDSSEPVVPSDEIKEIKNGQMRLEF
jgi:topoisomerase-4 subunit A